MAHIKEPNGINFLVDPTPLTPEDRSRISMIIAHYKATGRKHKVQKKTKSRQTSKPNASF
jgi:hypothetical protein